MIIIDSNYIYYLDNGSNKLLIAKAVILKIKRIKKIIKKITNRIINYY